VRRRRRRRKRRRKKPKKKGYYINWISIQWKIVVSSKNADKKSGFWPVGKSGQLRWPELGAWSLFGGGPGLAE
jgi:hypothetical protein